MLIACGYILNDDQLKDLAAARGLTIENREIYKLDSDLRRHHIRSVQAIPVDYPRGGRGVEPVPRTLMVTRYEDGSEDEILHPIPFNEDEEDRAVKRWLEYYGIRDTEFVTVPDPYFKINEFAEGD